MPIYASPSPCLYTGSALFCAVRPLVLASGSPRRKALLEELGLRPEIVSVEQAEPRPLPQEDPAVYVERAARLKAEAGARLRPGAAVLAADTIVVLPEDHPGTFSILGKPADEAEAVTMLTRLSGRTHQVITACCLIDPQQRIGDSAAVPLLFHDRTNVVFGAWPKAVLQAYAATGEPMDKAGAYAVQGVGSFLASRVEGSWSTVVGLPMDPVLRLLLKQGLIRPAGEVDA